MEHKSDPMRLYKMRSDGSGVIVGCSKAGLDEGSLEDILEAHIEMLDPNLCVIGRQVIMGDSGRLDLLAIDRNGDTAIIELKRGRATRSVVAQVLGYAASVEGMKYDDLNDIAREGHLGSCVDLRDLLRSRFGTIPETWNEHHIMYVVASEFNDTTHDIVDYLGNWDVPLYRVSFEVYRNGAEQFVRVSLVDDPPEHAEPES
ncbi:MAG: DUF91 domain-containing protein [Thaumarchaeota archaeon]|nr:DUF91 domain-containing protein [Nitrososphaerota archaeon]